MNIEAVILYCSSDEKFFKMCIENLLKTGVKCNVVTFTNLYAGDSENMEVLDRSNNLFKDNPDYKSITLQWKSDKSSLYHEAYGRYFATQNMVNPDCDYILYIDVDEIIDPQKFKLFLKSSWFNLGQALSYKLIQYTYAYKPIYRLKVKAYNTILCKYTYAKSLPLQIEARFNAYWNNKDKVSRWLAKLGYNSKFKIYKGDPFINHYTGVRTLDELLIKVKNWSHNTDKENWAEIVIESYGIKNNRISGHKFEIVENKFKI